MKKPIRIIVVGGVVQEVLDIPDDIEVVVQDYDIDESDPNMLEEDAYGDYYIESKWSN